MGAWLRRSLQWGLLLRLAARRTSRWSKRAVPQGPVEDPAAPGPAVLVASAEARAAVEEMSREESP